MNFLHGHLKKIMAQVYSLPGGLGAGRAPSMIVLSIGLNVLPAFLDFKIMNLQDVFPQDYYYTPCTPADGEEEDLPSASDEKSGPEASEPTPFIRNDSSTLAETAPVPEIVPVNCY
jgi:hypothetical protein